MSCQNPNRFVVICIDGEPLGITNPLPVTDSGPGSNVVVTDIEDGAGDSVMDPVNDAVRVNVVAGGAGGGAVTVADGADVTQGAIADVAVTGDSPGTLSAKLRGIVKILTDVWDAVHGRLVTVPYTTSPAAPAHAALTTTAETTLVAAPGSGLFIYVVDMTGSNGGSQRTVLSLKEGSGGTVRYQWMMAPNGGGFAHSMNLPWKLPENTALVTASSTAVSSAFVTVNYYIDN